MRSTKHINATILLHFGYLKILTICRIVRDNYAMRGERSDNKGP